MISEAVIIMRINYLRNALYYNAANLIEYKMKTA